MLNYLHMWKPGCREAPNHERMNTGLNPALPLSSSSSAATLPRLGMLMIPLEGGGGGDTEEPIIQFLIDMFTLLFFRNITLS